MAIKLIVTDLDGTLLTSNKTISDYTMQVLSRCKNQGIKLAIATGRPARRITRYQELFSPDYVIANNGATVSAKQTILRNLFIPAATVNRLLIELLSIKDVRQIAVEAENNSYSNYDDSAEIPDYWRSMNLIYNDLSGGISENVLKISAECENKALIQELVKNYPDLYLYSSHGDNWNLFTSKESTKISGIFYLCDLLGISLVEVAAFGDDNNDLDMLRRCGIGVATANAATAAIAAARFTCGTNDDDGVAKWIEQNIL